MRQSRPRGKAPLLSIQVKPRRPDPEWQPVSKWIFFLALAGGVLAAAVVLMGAWGWQGAHDDLRRSGQFWLWLVLLGLQGALWLAAMPLLWHTLRALLGYRISNAGELVWSTLGFLAWVALGLSGPAFLIKLPNYLPRHELRIGILSVTGAAVALAAAFAIWLLHGALRSLLHADDATDEQAKAHVDDVLRLRAVLQNLLFYLGAVLSLAILAAGAERQVVLQYTKLTHHGKAVPSVFPPEYVLVYGIYFSALLALVYVPTHRTLLQVGAHLRERLFPLPPPRDEDWADTYGKRKTLDELLQLQLGTSATLKAGFAVLTPLVGAVTGLLLGTK
jgi:hypothetical protein